MKLSKADGKAHRQALDLVGSGRALSPEERDFVVNNYHEGAEHMNGLAGAFFTPRGLAHDFAIEVPNNVRVLDLCAGIGALSYELVATAASMVCVEQNPAYASAGRVVVPEATWVNADVFDVDAYARFGPFDVVISNPPFGNIKTSARAKNQYSGGRFEFRLIELAAGLGASVGVFILPQLSTPFRFSGRGSYSRQEDAEYLRFAESTGLVMTMNCGIDTSYYRNDWKGVSPLCEIVLIDFPVQHSAGQAQHATQEASPMVATNRAAPAQQLSFGGLR